MSDSSSHPSSPHAVQPAHPAILIDAAAFPEPLLQSAIDKILLGGKASDLRAWCLAQPTSAMWRLLGRFGCQFSSAYNASDLHARMEAHCRVLGRIKSRPSEVALLMAPRAALRLVRGLADTGLRFVLVRTTTGGLEDECKALGVRVIYAHGPEIDEQETAARAARADGSNDSAGTTNHVAVACLWRRFDADAAARSLAYAQSIGTVGVSDMFFAGRLNQSDLVDAQAQAIGLHWRPTYEQAGADFCAHVDRLIRGLTPQSTLVLSAPDDLLHDVPGLALQFGVRVHLLSRQKIAANAAARWDAVINTRDIPDPAPQKRPAMHVASAMAGGVPIDQFLHAVGLRRPEFAGDPQVRRAARNAWLDDLRQQFPDLEFVPRVVVRPINPLRGRSITLSDVVAASSPGSTIVHDPNAALH